MTPYYADHAATLYQGDVREVLRGLEPESVQCVVTSPPYWSLRDYGIEPSVWGGEGGCEHEWGDPIVMAGQAGGTNQGSKADNPDGCTYRPSPPSVSTTCGRCGAWRGALGLEPTPDLFVAHMVEVFREVRRVLRDDGTLWLNIGDSYNAYNGNRGTESRYAGERTLKEPSFPTGHGLAAPALKSKDLVGIPWMLAFALRADGWYLRQDIIWHKPNPMPESVKDRCTKAHEVIFLLSKRARYWYDADAIREPALNTSGGRLTGSKHKAAAPGSAQSGTTIDCEGKVENRNKRSVWSIPTQPHSAAHFATFPPALVTPCILAGSRPGDTVLDPFVGSGTTAWVAKRLGRRAIGIDLNPDYLAMARTAIQLGRRQTRDAEPVEGQASMFVEVTP